MARQSGEPERQAAHSPQRRISSTQTRSPSASPHVRRGLGRDLGDAAHRLVAGYDRELLPRHADSAVVLREVRPAQPDGLDLEHRTAGRRLRFGELAHFVRAVAQEHRRSDAHTVTSGSTDDPVAADRHPEVRRRGLAVGRGLVDAVGHLAHRVGLLAEARGTCGRPCPRSRSGTPSPRARRRTRCRWSSA